MIFQYARQESNEPAISAENLRTVGQGGAKSGAFSDGSVSPELSLLLKLTAGLTTGDRAALARLLAGQE